MKRLKSTFSYTQLIALGFLGIILLGAVLLSTPLCSRDGVWTPFVDALITATSATCVTGLIAYDTYTHWNFFGQLVILLLIQIGGLGFMTFLTMFSFFIKRKIGLHERHLIMMSSGSMQMSGTLKLVRKILIGTLFFEGIGALLLATVFIPRMGMIEGSWNAIFHSISAFCNAGFDIMGKYTPFSSFTSYVDHPLINIVIMSLILIGGIGFLVWDDLYQKKFNFQKYELYTKIVLTTTIILVFVPALLFLIFEWNHAMADLTLSEKILASFFQSVTPRTAGFNTIDQTMLSEPGSMLTILLMFIGGNSGSTAGGIKVTTFVVLVLSSLSLARNNSSLNIFKRSISDETIKQASAIASIYLLTITAASLVITAIEPISVKEVLFEVVSGIGTVGLTMNITPTLGVISKLILSGLMYMGRVGGLSLVIAIASKSSPPLTSRPEAKILIG